jgi:S-disulfanyl-L-cysteine oxidoreductase SoxD
MSTLKRVVLAASIGAAIGGCTQTGSGSQVPLPRLGQPISVADAASWDISIPPDGTGLPPGRGTGKQGEPIYEAKCQTCHGSKGIGSLREPNAVKTVGSYWPYATTLFDYVRRAMPFHTPKSLTADETYALSAYILHLNGLVGADTVLDAQSLPKVTMPNRDGFVSFPRNPK